MMNLEPQNSIHKAELNFKFNTSRSDILNGNDFVAWAKTHVLEIIDAVACEWTTDGMLVEIPELVIEIEVTIQEDIFSSSDTFKRNLREQMQIALGKHGVSNREFTIGQKANESVRAQIEAALKKAIREHKTHQIPIAEARANKVLTFLKTGQLESKLTNDQWENLVTEFYEELIKNKALQKRWVATLKNQDAFIRFFRLKSVAEQQEFLAVFTQERHVVERLKQTIQLFNANPDYFLFTTLISFYERIYQLLPTFNRSLTKVLAKVIAQQMIRQKIAIQHITIPKQVAKEVKLAMAFATKSNSEDNALESLHFSEPLKNKGNISSLTEENTLEEAVKEGTYVGQAGLVLLANFLPQFFKNSGYLNADGSFKDIQDIPILLHYMATGEMQAPEWKLSLPKIMTGLNLGQHCNTALVPTKKLKTQINELLLAVIGHWKSLKNTSPEGLRETFLIREGVLKSKNGFYYLEIEDKTLDILLNYVPWNFSTIKLNWMQCILFVEWNKS